MSTEALGTPRGTLLEIDALAQPGPFAVIRLDAAHGLALDFEGQSLCAARFIAHAGKHAVSGTFDLLIQNRHRLVATLMWWYFE